MRAGPEATWLEGCVPLKLESVEARGFFNSEWCGHLNTDRGLIPAHFLVDLFRRRPNLGGISPTGLEARLEFHTLLNYSHGTSTFRLVF